MNSTVAEVGSEAHDHVGPAARPAILSRSSSAKGAGRLTAGRSARAAGVLGFLAVASQRIGVGDPSAGSLAAPTVVVFLTLLWAFTLGGMRPSPGGVLRLASLAVVTAVATLLGSGARGLAPSLTALVLLLLTYSVTLLSDGRSGDRLGKPFFGGAVLAITIGAALGLVQYVVQALGRGYPDLVGMLPKAMLLQGYNTYYSLEYFGGTAGEFKPNGMIFLEPSSMSLYAAIVAVWALGRVFAPLAGEELRGRALAATIGQLLVLFAAIAVSASASGLLVLGAAGLPLLLAVRRHGFLLLVLVVAVLGALSAGLFDAIITKASEGLTGDTSTSLRLFLPYEALPPYWLQRPLTGWGAGTAASFVDDTGLAGLQATTTMKALLEYGLFGAVVLALIVLAALRRSGAPLRLILAVVAAWWLPSDQLVNGTLVLLMLFGLAQWSRKGTDEDATTDETQAPGARLRAKR